MSTICDGVFTAASCSVNVSSRGDDDDDQGGRISGGPGGITGVLACPFAYALSAARFFSRNGLLGHDVIRTAVICGGGGRSSATFFVGTGDRSNRRSVWLLVGDGLCAVEP